MDPDELEIQHQAKQLRELFKGRFTQNELVMVIKEFGGKLPALDFIIREDPGVVSQFLKKNKNYIETLQRDSQNLCRCLEEGINIESSKRQFACKKCERSWWKVVPIRKEVSKCKICGVKFDPIPRDKEWGIGVFYCLGENCGKEFKGFAVMGMTESMCHRCGFDSPVDHILPPRKKTGEERRTRDNHGCNGINCYNGSRNPNRGRYNYWQNSKPAICIHPKSKAQRPPDIRFRTWSEVHRTTGSTVSTFLDQHSIDTGSGSFAYTMETRSISGSSRRN